MANQEQQPGFVHNVFFWLKETVSETERTTFVQELQRLAKIKTIQSLYVGTPAGTPRTVVDNSYDFALIIHFGNSEDHDAYQVDPLHDAFIATQSRVWTKVQIYDVLTL